jgi:CRISPR-associated protein Cas5d
MKPYEIALEIAGPYAMWTRPDAGDATRSYPAPTYSAAKGLFESVLFLNSAEVRPVCVEICAPISYHKYTTNYGGPLRKDKLFNSGDNYRLHLTVLINVKYKIYAEAVSHPEGYHHARNPKKYSRREFEGGAARYKEEFEKRLKRGQYFHVPFLGLREFVPDYFAETRDETQLEKSINLTIPSMLFTVYKGHKGHVEAEYKQGLQIKEGALTYA